MKHIETLDDFQSEFGTEKQCLDFLTCLRWPDGYRCPRCGHDKAWRLNERKYKCKNCKYQTTATAGTLFQDTHLPLTAWFRAIWYVSSNPEQANATGLQRETGIRSYKTAFSIFQKIKRANAYKKTPSLLQGNVEVSKSFVPVTSCYVIVAVEIKDKKIRHIQAALQDDLSAFIEKNIKPQSVLTVDGWNGSHLSTNYEINSHTYRYTYPYTKKVRERLEQFLRKKNNGKKIQDRTAAELLVKEFCENKNNDVIDTDFYELVQKMIQIQPLTNGPNHI